MDHTRFDALTRRVSTGLNRRTALKTGFGGLAATLGIARLQGAAQEASPVPAGSADLMGTTAYLFVQVATGGTWEPKPDDPDVYLLTLTGAAAQTIYFSDRPAHIVGSVPTETVLTSLGFTPANPPNAAVVTRTDGGEDVLVVELFNPTYDEVSGTLTYEARILADYEGEDLAHLAARQGDGALPATFGEVSLFIDDANCPNPSEVQCTLSDGTVLYTFSNLPSCFDYLGNSTWACFPCEGAPKNDGTNLMPYWSNKCNETVAECNGKCIAGVYGPG